MSKKNARSLDTIAADIHKHDRQSVYTIGALLLEAKEACEHGDWGKWLKHEFGWSHRTADYYMAAARLARKFATVAILKLPTRTISYLSQLNDDVARLAIKELQKVAAKTQVSEKDANRIIELANCKHRFGDWPDHVLDALNLYTDCSGYYHGEEWAKLQAALKAAGPETFEAALAVIHEIIGSSKDDDAEPYEDESRQEEDSEGEADQDDDDPEVDARTKKLAFLLRMTAAREAAVYDGPVDSEIIEHLRATVAEYSALLMTLESSVSGRKIDPKVAAAVARAEARRATPNRAS